MLKSKSPPTSAILEKIYKTDYTKRRDSDYYHKRYAEVMNTPKSELHKLVNGETLSAEDFSEMVHNNPNGILKMGPHSSSKC